ncbi:hypothetical protein GSI_04703 [Ganoderma sinense ZZ0214-1]|uniref:AB hydrolase-1 domain-containing protein n=1 Tax=Ganoderma sinense ZZ0214-1 TaxID=1077348 RepID=A0A2G8SHL0_9APHY|nr:hypothetical protein GSI_04703 [Ganoderma sinense ZZ0214-1]
MASVALSTVLDSGAPDGRTDYTTIVLIHGRVMGQSGTFKKLLPLASGHGVGIIAANRRDYPGSHPYTPEERARLERLAAASPEAADVRSEAENFLRERGREVYDYLVDLVKREAIPPTRAEGDDARGGIVLVGWSV